MAAASYEELRARVKALEQELAEERGPVRDAQALAIRHQVFDAQAKQIYEFCQRAFDAFGSLSAAYDAGDATRFEELLDGIADAAFYPATDGHPALQATDPPPADLLTGTAFPARSVVAGEAKN